MTATDLDSRSRIGLLTNRSGDRVPLPGCTEYLD